MEIFIGTSGWQYDWNPNGFEWYLKNSKLNSIELNASFYRFPFKNQIKNWKEKTEKINKIRWSIKVNRLITHVFKFNERAIKTWKKFFDLFSLLENFIDFYLFQLPPYFKPKGKMYENLIKFIKSVNLKERFALEVRNVEWYNEEVLNELKSLQITFVSVDAPFFTNLPREIFSFNDIVYLRMHGRTFWYSHDYSEKELKEVALKILKAKPKKVYIYFNNDHAMLKNAQKMFEIFRSFKLK